MTVIKKISELEQMDALSDEANVLVEENGDAKRFPAKALGGSAEGAVLYTAQELTPEQQAQAQKNIGLAPLIISRSEMYDHAVIYPTYTAITGSEISEQFASGREVMLFHEVSHEENNELVHEFTYIPLSRTTMYGDVYFETSDTVYKVNSPGMFSEEKKTDAGATPGAVLYTEQALTVQEQRQAQKNMGVAGAFARTVNLYNEAANKTGIVISGAGVETENAGFNTTDYIYLTAGDYVMTCESTKMFSFMSMYNIDKVFKSRSDVKSGSFTMPEDGYVRFSGTPSRMSGLMLVAGDTLPSVYIPYGYTLTLDNLLDKSLRKEKLDFVGASENLVNHMTATKGYCISASGVVTANDEYAISDKLYLKKKTVYTCNHVHRVSYFDNEGTHIQSITYDSVQKTFTTPEVFDYAILSLSVSARYPRWQLNEGSELLEYKKHHIVVDGFRIYDDFDVEVDPIKAFANKDRVVFDKAPLFTLDDEVSGVEDSDKSVAAILNKYDALMAANPLYITKTEIGEDISGNTLYRYDFKNPAPYHALDNLSSKATPKVILISGIHGEYGGIYSLYNTMEQITANPSLQHLKNEVHFIVVPVVNIWGVTNSTRTNANGVDLARNFEVDWGTNPGDTDPNASTYCGTAALSELESQAIDRLMAENSDAICFTSCHSFQKGVDGDHGFIWGALATVYGTNLGDKLMVKLSQEWLRQYDNIASSNGYTDHLYNYIGFVDRSAPAGSEGRQAMKYGIHGGTLEVCDYFHFPEMNSQHLTGFVISRGTEAYINWILLNVYNYDPNF